MFTVLEQTLAEFAAQQCVAVLIQPVGEVLARHANPCSPEGDESPLVYPGPFLHRLTASTYVLAAGKLAMQGRCASPTPISMAG